MRSKTWFLQMSDRESRAIRKQTLAIWGWTKTTPGRETVHGVFDRKLHLAGAEWGAWLVDKNAEFHGGFKTPSPATRTCS